MRGAPSHLQVAVSAQPRKPARPALGPPLLAHQPSDPLAPDPPLRQISDIAIPASACAKFRLLRLAGGRSPTFALRWPNVILNVQLPRGAIIAFTT